MNPRSIQISESKSLINRLLILDSFADLKPLSLRSQAKDVVELARALKDLKLGATEFHISDGGTTLRFLLARLSRENGVFRVHASPRLLSRPLDELIHSLNSLGVEIIREADSILVKSQGWILAHNPIEIDCSRSTQFASAILLCTAGLPFAIQFKILNLAGSKPYLDMTLETMRASGISYHDADGLIQIQERQKVSTLPAAEIDVSSAFSIAAVGVVSQSLEIQNFPTSSLQADSVFIELLGNMGAKISLNQATGTLEIQEGIEQLKPIDCNLEQSPDLFPVLAALSALTDGKSTFTGLHSLKHKESDRLNQTCDLIEACGAKTDRSESSATVTGPVSTDSSFKFNPDHDHRLAMAAAVLKAHGVDIQILQPDVVQKSFPDFWKVSGVRP